jgi:hypothetical protein
MPGVVASTVDHLSWSGRRPYGFDG